MTTILWDIFYSEISKLSHSNEACILLPTFPAGQIGKKRSRRAWESVWFVDNSMWSGINRETCIKFHWILSVIPSMRGDYGLQSWFLWCSVQAPTISHHCSPGLEQRLLCLLAGSFPMHPSHFSWILFLPNRSDCLSSWVFLGHQAKCHTHAKLFIIYTHPQPYSHHMLYHYDLYFMESKTTFTVRHDIILRPPKENKQPIKLL